MKLATLFVNISGRADLNSLPGNLPEDTCNWNSCWHSVSTQYNMTSCGNRFQINQASIKNFPQWFRTTYTTKLSSDYCFHKRKLAGRATVSNLEMTVESCQSLLYGELNSDYSLKDGRDFSLTVDKLCVANLRTLCSVPLLILFLMKFKLEPGKHGCKGSQGAFYPTLHSCLNFFHNIPQQMITHSLLKHSQYSKGSFLLWTSLTYEEISLFFISVQ